MNPSLALSLVDLSLTLLPARLTSDQARRMLISVGLQESRFAHRRQIRGPARGYWMFEAGGGVRGVLEHPASREWARMLLGELDCEDLVETGAVHAALEFNDLLAAGFARLLLWTLPSRLPVTEAEGWDQYLAAWRPGRPHPETWTEMWRRGTELVYGGHHAREENRDA